MEYANHDSCDMEFQIHCIETEAYSAVLRAFVAQSDVLSWDKEGLISELRKELRVSDVEHREIRGKVDSDDFIKVIREQRGVTAIQQEPSSNTMGPPHKKLKTANIMVPSTPKYLPCAQPSPAVFPLLTTHCRDNQWGDDAAVFSIQGNVVKGLKSVAHDRQAPNMGKGRVSLTVQPSMNYLIPRPRIDSFKRGSDTIHIRATDKLIHEVEMVFRAEHPDRALVERAKLILKEHERALLEALKKIGGVSDADKSPDCLQQHYCNEEEQRKSGHESHHTFYSGKADRMRGYSVQDLHRDRSDRLGTPYVDLKN